ncbi:uncharacterized protein [Nicotiana sylvestris]|uniref:uncharacterized protein n=1 Tax=Nicotiana sylvestris TaxID=4096 RepID=UPI00388C8263
MPNTIDLSPQHAPSFTTYHKYPGTSAQTFQALPAKTTSYHVSTSAPIFLPPPQATLHRSSSEPAFPAQDTQYYAPEPTFNVPDPYSYTPHFETHVETDKPPKNTEQEEMFRKVKSVDYKVLCLFPDVQLPVGFKMPKFDLYDGHGDPVAHLRGYCSKMRDAGGKDKLLMAYVSHSLSGVALEWYTRQDANKWYTWDDMAQAFARHFQYNIDIVPDRLSLTKVEKKPSESLREYGFQWREQDVRVNPSMEEDEMVEYFLQALEPTYYDHLISAIGHDIEKCWHLKRAIQELIDTNQIVVQNPDTLNINQNPFPAHAEMHMIEIVHKDGEPKKFSKSVMMIRASESNLVKAPNSTKAKPLTVEGATKKPSSLNLKLPVLVVKGPSKDIGASPESSKVVVPGIPSKPVIVVKGAPITPIIIKPVTQLLVVDAKDVPWNYKQVIVTYKRKEIEEEVNETGGLTLSRRYEHRRVLMKILNEAHVPDKITVNHSEKIASKIFKVNKITFSDDELSMEGTEHNRALYLMVKCEDSVVSRVLVDNGSRPVEFTMEFQVLDVVVSYNLLLGRPWIHAAKAVPSSLHQMVKLKWDRQEIVVHGDEDMSACNDTIVLFIEAEDDKGPWVYKTFETVFVEKIPEGKCIPGPKLSSASAMVANEMLKNGFVPGKGLGSSLQGIVHLVRPSGNSSTFGLGFMPTEKDVKRVKNLKQKDDVMETKISVHLELQVKEEIIKTLFDYKDVFAWSYNVMPGLSTNLVVHKLPTDPAFPPVKKNLRKFKTDMSVKIKEEITKQLTTKVIRVTRYPTWLANVVPVPKKDGKTRFCVDCRDLNKASPKDDFPLPNINILIDNCAKHEIGSFVDCYAGYNQILMDEEDTEKTAFITPWGTYCYRVMPFGLKNAGATYMRAMPTIFHDMIHKEIEVYIDDVIIKSKKQSDHVKDLRMFFQRLRRYNLKFNPAKCAFGVPSGKLLGFVVNRRGIELDPSKIKAIQELSPSKNKIEVMSLLGRLNYISRFIAQLTTTCEPIFKLLKKNVALKWTDECQEAFDKIKRYLLNPHVLVLPEPGRPLILFLTVLDNSFGCVLGQHDITGKKEQTIYYLKFDIIYVTRTAMKAQALADHLVENPVDDEYEPLKTYFPDEEVMCVDEADHDENPGWKLFFNGAANMKGV